jgi:hypothetical protein
LGVIEWNSLEPGTSLIEVFTRTSGSMSGVTDATSCTADNTTDLFTAALHGLIDTDRVRIGGTAVPAGTNGNLMYYVVSSLASTFAVSLTSGGAAVDFSTDGTAVTFKRWDEQTDGFAIEGTGSVANVWIQYLIAFTTSDTVIDNPKVFSSDSFVLRFFYERGGQVAETNVDFQYETGNMNFDLPFGDKIYDKINTWHEGSGSFTFDWETENASGTLNVDMDVAPTTSRWDSFFQDNAFGRRISIKFSKNDLLPFKLKEIHGIYLVEPNIL